MGDEDATTSSSSGGPVIVNNHKMSSSTLSAKSSNSQLLHGKAVLSENATSDSAALDIEVTPTSSSLASIGESVNNNPNAEGDCNNDPKHLPRILRNHVVGENSKSRANNHSNLNSPTSVLNPMVHGRSPATTSRWTKLRTTMSMTTTIAAQTKQKRLERQDSFIKKFTTQRGGIESAEGSDDEEGIERPPPQHVKFSNTCVVEPHSTLMAAWMGVVTLAVIYNLWTCIAREAFVELRQGYEAWWFTFDGVCDLVYIFDIGVQIRTTYLERGLTVRDNKKLAMYYIRSKYFIADIISLLPLDLFQILVGIHPMLRFPRFIKIHRAWRWKTIVENRTVFPNAWRVANLTHLLFLGCHWFAAFYFLISKAENFKSSWGYPEPVGEYAQVTRMYLKSLYWSTLTLTTIGDLPPPILNWEYIFTITSYFIGVFVFATIVGQVGNVITNRNASRLEFEKILDNAKNFMRRQNVPKDLQKRVLRWYDYAWSRGHANGAGDLNALALLPDKLKTELALHVNLETLRKVTIFQECRPEFLHDLVLKMRPYIFTPRDLICRKGEVAREMFIIADGLLEVISDSGEVLKQMGSGDFFGEIGILNLDGGVNRRTADVVSIGYSELFVLSKEDVLSALQDHPDAETVLTDYARTRLKELELKSRKTSTSTHERIFVRIDSNDNSPSIIHCNRRFSVAARTAHPSTQDGTANLLQCVDDMIQVRVKEVEEHYILQIKQLEEKLKEKDEHIAQLETDYLAMKDMSHIRSSSVPFITRIDDNTREYMVNDDQYNCRL